MIDPPLLIQEAILLASSIRKNHPCAGIYAGLPRKSFDRLPKPVADFLDALGVERLKLEDSPFEPAYPHGNKILALCALPSNIGAVFVDTDTLIWKNFAASSLIKPKTIAVAPEGRKTWGKPQSGHNWDYIYELFNLPLPTERIKLARTGVESYPYFNAGVIGIGEDAAQFGVNWLSTALKIDRDDKIVGKRPWLDQISLPITIAASGLKFDVLDQNWNLSLSRAPDAVDAILEMNAADPNILHYHKFEFMQGTRYEPYLDALIQEYTLFKSFDEMAGPFVRRRKLLDEIWEKMS